MEVVKAHRNKIVCDKCKSRKGKCDGANPCSFCKRNELPCSYNTLLKKRGRKRKADCSPSSEEILQENCANIQIERSYFVNLFRLHTKYDIGEDHEILTPTSNAHRMLLSSVMAWGHRLFGAHKWAEDMLKDAHVQSRLVFDDPSLVSVAAFKALSWYYGSGPKCSHYASIANSLAKQLPINSLHIKRIQFEMFLMNLLQDTTLPGIIKYRTIMDFPDVFHRDGLVGCNCKKCSPVPATIQHKIIRGIALIALKIDSYYDPTAYIKLLNCSFTTQERDTLIEVSDTFEASMSTASLFGKGNYAMLVPMKTIKAVLLYLEGDIHNSKLNVLQIIHYSQYEAFYYVMHSNPGPLVLLAGLALRLGLVNEAQIISKILSKMCTGNVLDSIIQSLPSLDWFSTNNNTSTVTYLPSPPSDISFFHSSSSSFLSSPSFSYSTSTPSLTSSSPSSSSSLSPISAIESSTPLGELQIQDPIADLEKLLLLPSTPNESYIV